MPLRHIANTLGIPEKSVSGWKCKDRWEEKLSGVLQLKKWSTPKKSGAPKGNKNAAGYGAPFKNKNAEKHGLFSKYLPPETLELVEYLQTEDEIARLKRNIAIQEAAIIRSQSIMNVESKGELIKHLKKVQTGKVEMKEWEFQYAWDRQGSYLNSLSRAMQTLAGMYKTLAELTSEDPGELKNTIGNFVEALNSASEDVWDDVEAEDQK